MWIKVLTTFGSVITIGFGIWHFTVPSAFKWYSYIVPSATELALAVRTVNLLFSLCLVLLGAANLIFLYAVQNKPSLAVLLALSCILWGARLVTQLVEPQGSVNPLMQYGMLAAFILTFLCFLISLILLLSSFRG